MKIGLESINFGYSWQKWCNFTKNIHLWKAQEGASWHVDQRAFAGHTASVEDIQWSPNESNVRCECICLEDLYCLPTWKIIHGSEQGRNQIHIFKWVLFCQQKNDWETDNRSEVMLQRLRKYLPWSFYKIFTPSIKVILLRFYDKSDVIWNIVFSVPRVEIKCVSRILWNWL